MDESSRQPLECPFAKRYPSELLRDDAYYMQWAFNEAIEAWKRDEVPVGAVIAYGGQVVARAHNHVDSLKDPSAHAEMLAITKAAHVIGDWRLNGATLYVTKEPCPMCSGAAIMARLERVVYGVRDPKMGCLGGATALHLLPRLNHSLDITAGVMEVECRDILQAYFALKRRDS